MCHKTQHKVTPYFETESGKLYQGDCLEVMKTFEDNTFDTMITDPPYGLSFMGKKWDYDVPGVDVWKECLRVLKPGATALIFAGSRTQHRMAVNVEDAGFILKDTIMWIYGSGFPKSTDISKQIDKYRRRDYVLVAKELGLLPKDANRSFIDWTTEGHAPGEKHWKGFKRLIPENDWQKIEREVIGKSYTGGADAWVNGMDNKEDGGDRYTGIKGHDITVPATNEAKTWNGWGTALKPAYEPILVAMKPNDGTYAQNAMEWGVAGLNIDGGRIGTEIRTYDLKGGENLNKLSRPDGNDAKDAKGCGAYGLGAKQTTIGKSTVKGRFPANIILDEEAGRLLDEQSGILKSGANLPHHRSQGISRIGAFKIRDRSGENDIKASQGGASRFFYCAKASKAERGEGNNHPTVKSLKLMEYLCTLTKTPTGGTVLDPFAGSGTTGLACMNTGRQCVLIEKEDEYCRIAEKRIDPVFSKLRF